ncbi:hypothetical protein AMTRI_Chr06g199410 [Amborella trichopoda]|uniref:CAAX prenyl protease 2/Lysostaphin resistance protein A-like domain-containing protein n=1 Tax=Amborella trichopoda TaxID=13333 RepID=W1PZX9_AMBTC|nr:uncharacterized protein LOC18442001 [Amborella trichopoda]ERN13754.1 hypothetical protein AMTR_s00049p00185080 [Amborella trichopoda]|eukprot:XP_006852287.1 uncharacterized protein LOC18442001 [Amborella trichopoda]
MMIKSAAISADYLVFRPIGLLFSGSDSSHFKHRGGSKPDFAVSAKRNSKQKLSRNRGKLEQNTIQITQTPLDELDRVPNSISAPIDNPSSQDDFIHKSSHEILVDDKSSLRRPSRDSVLQACVLTSGSIFALGAIIRQISHISSMEGWAVPDTLMDVSFDFEWWHLQLITGSIITVSSCRYFLLKMWPEFAESSEAANQQVLSSLNPLDYAMVAFLPGISEELLFRGALLPLFGLNWKSALVIGSLFGALHLGNGRKLSFAIWASVVGFIYGLGTIMSSSVLVPMASHSLNNLIGATLWRYSSKNKTEM